MYEQIKFKYIINILFFDVSIVYVCNYVSMYFCIAIYICICYICASMYVYIVVLTCKLIPGRGSIQPLGAAVPAGI